MKTDSAYLFSLIPYSFFPVRRTCSIFLSFYPARNEIKPFFFKNKMQRYFTTAKRGIENRIISQINTRFFFNSLNKRYHLAPPSFFSNYVISISIPKLSVSTCFNSRNVATCIVREPLTHAATCCQLQPPAFATAYIVTPWLLSMSYNFVMAAGFSMEDCHFR